MRGESDEDCDELCVCLVTVHTYAPAAPLHAIITVNQRIKTCELFLKKVNTFHNEMFIPTLLIAEMQ